MLLSQDLAMPTLTAAKDGSVSVGDPVIVAGNPRGLEGTFSSGIVSAIRDNPDLIQIDAPISPGSSGGPVVNSSGQFIGIATSFLQGGQNLNFAIPLYNRIETHNLNSAVRFAAALSLTDLDLKHLKGRPRSMEVRHADVSVDNRSRRYAEGRSIVLETYTFDENGMITAETHGRNMSWKTEYWEASIPKRTLSQQPDGTLPHEYSWMEGAEYRASRVHFGETVIAGDQEGPSKRQKGEDSHGYLSMRYDQSGNEIANETYLTSVYNDRNVHRFESRFDEDGRETEQVSFIDGKVQAWWKSTYKVDAIGNWIRRVMTYFDDQDLNGTVQAVEYREIKYY
jgi:hypothetical protein